MDQLKFLDGPISFVYFPDVLGRKWFLFGDEHHSNHGRSQDRNSPECLSIKDYLQAVFLTSRIKIDFYLEIPFVRDPS